MNISKSSVHQWLKEFSDICTYNKFRSEVLKNCGKEILVSKTFEHIWTLKPNACRENEQKVSSQLYLYASGLSFRTGIKLENFRCAWFDDKVYYEFDPSQAKVRFTGSKWRSKSGPKQRVLKGKATNFVSRAGNKSWKDSGSGWKGLKQKWATDFGISKEEENG